MKRVLSICILILLFSPVFAMEESTASKSNKISMSEEEFDRLFEDDSLDLDNYHSNTIHTRKNKDKFDTESEIQSNKEIVQVEDFDSESERIGRTSLSINYGLIPTTMFTEEPFSLMVPMSRNNPYFNMLNLKFTYAINQYLYSGFTLDSLIGEYGRKIQNSSLVPEFSYGASVLAGFNLDLGNYVRFFGEADFNVAGEVINQTVPEAKKATKDVSFGYGLGCGFDLCFSNGLFFTIGYKYDWEHYCSKFVNGKVINGKLSRDSVTLLASPDYVCTSIYAGIGFTW